jgi:hypothetical protein
MRASKGDQVSAPSQRVGTPERHGEIVEVRDEDRGPPFLARWGEPPLPPKPVRYLVARMDRLLYTYGLFRLSRDPEKALTKALKQVFPRSERKKIEAFWAGKWDAGLDHGSGASNRADLLAGCEKYYEGLPSS